MIDRLIRFCGYGNFETANIIFLGNEEGLGGGEIKNELKKRTRNFWKSGRAIDGNDKQNGYYIYGHGGGVNTRGHFLEFCSRLMLQINQVDALDYFQTNGANPGVYNHIRDYKMESLYNEDPNVFDFRSVLMDYRPLPRANESMTYQIYNEIDPRFKWEHYERAFDLRPRNVDEYHATLRKERARIMNNVFNRDAETKVIIGIGKKEIKKKFFENYYEFEIPFEGIRLSREKIEAYYGKIKIGQRIIPVFLSDFFQSGMGIGLNGLRLLSNMIEKVI